MRTPVAAILLLATCLLPLAAPAQQSVNGSGVIHGFIRDSGTGEAVSLASLEITGVRQVLSDRRGYFSVARLPEGTHRLRVRAFGFEPLDTTVQTSAAPVELLLQSAPLAVAGITVEASRALERPFDAPEASVRTVTPAEIRRVPAVLEADLFRSLQALPGVGSPGVLSSRLLVRGGAADQNLFLLDGYPVLQPYHLGGAFSAFHTEAVQDAEMWIGAPPARFGGALSSVLDVSLREGNRERTTGTATLGTVSSSTVVEGGHPRGAWFMGARRTYLDVAGAAADHELPYYFYDTYAKSYADLTSSDRVSALVFLGGDRIYNPVRRDREHFEWSNDVYGLSWRRLFSGRAVLEQRVSLSRFSQELRGGYTSLQQARIATDHRVSLLQVQGELRWSWGERHRLETGYAAQRVQSEHRVEYTYGMDWHEEAETSHNSGGTLLAAYLQDDVVLSSRLRLRLGLRAEAAEGERSLQPRVAAKYLLSDNLSLSAAAATIRQYSQTLQDPDVNFDVYTVDLAPTALGDRQRAARSTHLVGGVEARLAHDLRVRGEVYAKRFDDLWILASYEPARRRFATQRLEPASGSAEGLDLSLSREAAGRVRGWVGYSLARSRRTIGDASFAAEPHPRQSVVVVWDTEATRKWGLTGRFEAAEGVPFTPAVAMIPRRTYDFNQGQFSDLCRATFHATGVEYLYGDRNSARTGWGKRLDLGAGRRWTDRRGWKWEVSLSLLNTLFDPSGVFRPAPAHKQNGCDMPEDVERDYELVLPPIPSVGLRLVF
ncbi:hypothetical protein BH23GEM3_BH23GEM3_03110 [soil metagenome]